MAKIKTAPIQPDWISKILAGGLLGFALAIALSGLFAWLGPGGVNANNKGQFIMWIVPPLWMTFFSLVFLFRTGIRAWITLGTATIIAFLALGLARYLLGS